MCVVEKGLSLALGCRSSAKKKKREQKQSNVASNSMSILTHTMDNYKTV